MIPKVPKVFDALHSASGGVIDRSFPFLLLFLDRVLVLGFGYLV